VTATWVANEFFSSYGGNAAVSLTPGANGRFEVYLDGEKIFDKKAEGNAMPDLIRVRKMKQVIQAKLDSIPAAAD
jgi:predicted Rdx family selenoprotein